jgi:hypothetical protein
MDRHETENIDRRDWAHIAPEYRRRWQQGHPEEPEEVWPYYEPWYRYGYEMAYDPRFEGLQWADVEADLEIQYPEWAEQQGYGDRHDEGLWDRFKDKVREAWDRAAGDG